MQIQLSSDQISQIAREFAAIVMPYIKPNKNEIIDIKEAARRINKSVPTIRLYAKTKPDFPPPIKLGGTLNWESQDIENWKKQQKVKSEKIYRP